MKILTSNKNVASIVLMLSGLFFSLSAQSATVYVSRGGMGVINDSSLAATSGAGYNAIADLQQGTFKTLSIFTAPAGSTGSFGGFTYAGITDLILTNSTPSPITIAAGNFSVHFEGTFAFTPGPTGQSEASG